MKCFCVLLCAWGLWVQMHGPYYCAEDLECKPAGFRDQYRLHEWYASREACEDAKGPVKQWSDWRGKEEIAGRVYQIRYDGFAVCAPAGHRPSLRD
jgi:hypothetical protein